MPPALELAVYDADGLPVDALTLTYGGGVDASRQLTAEITGGEGEFDVVWTSDNKRVATVDDTGLVTATGIGTTTIYASIGGALAQPVEVTVARRDGTSNITYRALIVASFQTPGQAGYLNFGKNSTDMVYNTISSSNVDGGRYIITYTNSVRSAADFESAVRAAFADSKEGDVNLIFTRSHGTVSNG